MTMRKHPWIVGLAALGIAWAGAGCGGPSVQKSRIVPRIPDETLAKHGLETF